MKKVHVLVSIVCMVFVSLAVNAQGKASPFTGKWELTSVGSPNGDSKMLLALEQKEGKLSGTINIHDQDIKLNQVEAKGNNIDLYFEASGYDILISLEKKDNNTLEGSGMGGMVGIKGKRVTE